MHSIHKDLELTVPVDRDMGAISRVRTILDSCGTNVLAWRVCYKRSGRDISMVANDPLKAARALEEAGLDYRIGTVVLARMPNKFGAIGMLDAYLRNARIGVRYSYASSLEGRYVYMVFKTTDDEGAVEVLRKKLLPTWICHHQTLKAFFLKDIIPSERAADRILPHILQSMGLGK